MIVSLILAAALQAAAPAAQAAPQAAPAVVAAATPLADFKALCVDTKADQAAVTAALAARGGWSTPAQQDGLTAWTHTGEGVERVVLAGDQTVEGKARAVCMISTRPATPALAMTMRDALGGAVMAVDASAGLYAYAASAEAYRAGDITFVSVTSDAESTSLTAIRPKA